MLMYQNRRGITGLPWRLLATNCTSQRPPNISAPTRPISFQGEACRPVQASHSIGEFITFATISEFLGRGAAVARDQPGHAAQVADADQGAVEVVVLGHP